MYRCITLCTRCSDLHICFQTLHVQDYDRDPKMFRELEPFEVLVLCSKLHIVSRAGCTDEHFKKCIKHLLKAF